MLAALSLRSVLGGIAAGALTATVLGLASAGILALLDVADGPDIGLLVGVMTGLFVGGWLAGRTSLHSHRFHGSVTGLLICGFLVIVASASATSATISSVLLLVLIGVVLGGLGGWLGGRRRAGTRVE